MRRSFLGLAVLAVMAAGCSTSTGSTTGGPLDAGADVTNGAPYDAGPPGLDAGGVDTGEGAPPDAANDAGTDAAPAVPTPYACPSGAPAAVFVSEVAPPATMAPWAHASTSVTYANCSTATWSATAAPPNGIKLGAAAPHDLGTWTPTRIALPADVPVGYAITIPIEVHAPPLTGPHAYAFELVQDGVAWLGQPSPTHTIDVEPAAAPPVVLCGTTTADPTGGTDAAAALQACINATPSGGTLALPAGIFRLASVVSITQPMTLTTTGTSGAANCLDYATLPCAVLRADTNVLPSAAATRGFFRLGSAATQVTGVTLDHVVVDGDRSGRLASSAASACASGQNGDGINVGANCASCTLAHMVSARALCGSGMEWDGDGITVTDSVFWGNGDHDTQNMWSDGLTIHTSNGGSVTNSIFIDNSDVDFISGGGTNATYTNNTVEQLSQPSFAGMMLDNFDNPAIGDHTGATLSQNFVTCPAICHFGIELGPHPWYQSPNIIGGTASNNTVTGAYIEINAQGAGTQAAPTTITGNTLGPTPSSAAFQCGNISGLSPLNVSSESIVNLGGGTATGAISVPCP